MSTENENNQEPEEIADTSQEEVVDQIEEAVAEEVTEVVEKAKSTGHLTKEEFVAKGGKPDEYKTEKEYVLTGELIDLKKTLQKRDKDIEEILKYQQLAIERQKQSFRQELESRLNQAREVGDIQQVEKITQEKVRAEIQETQEKQTRMDSDVREAVQEFAERNSDWYNESHPELVRRCAELDTFYMSQSPGISLRERAVKIENQVRAEMSLNPSYLKITAAKMETSRPNISSSRSAVTASGSNISDASDDKLYTKLSSEEKAMYNSLKRIQAKVDKTKPLTVKEFAAKIRNDSTI